MTTQSHSVYHFAYSARDDLQSATKFQRTSEQANIAQCIRHDARRKDEKTRVEVVEWWSSVQSIEVRMFNVYPELAALIIHGYVRH